MPASHSSQGSSSKLGIIPKPAHNKSVPIWFEIRWMGKDLLQGNI
jgi:hypothetical protein